MKKDKRVANDEYADYLFPKILPPQQESIKKPEPLEQWAIVQVDNHDDISNVFGPFSYEEANIFLNKKQNVSNIFTVYLLRELKREV